MKEKGDSGGKKGTVTFFSRGLTAFRPTAKKVTVPFFPSLSPFFPGEGESTKARGQ